MKYDKVWRVPQKDMIYMKVMRPNFSNMTIDFRAKRKASMLSG